MSSSGNGLTNGKAAKKRRRRLVIGSIAVLILICGGYGVFAALRPSHEIDPSKLAAAERGDLAKVVVATGKIQPLSKVEVKSKASGIVKKLYVDYGDHVKSGQLLAELDKIQLEASLRAAQASIRECTQTASLSGVEGRASCVPGHYMAIVRRFADRAGAVVRSPLSCQRDPVQADPTES